MELWILVDTAKKGCIKVGEDVRKTRSSSMHGSENLHDFREAGDLVVAGCDARMVGVPVKEERFESCLVCSTDVCIRIVANHQCGVRVGMCLCQGISEELFRGFVGPGIFAENDGVEASVEVGCL